MGFLKSQTIFYVKMTTESICLKDVLWDRERMKCDGWLIVQNLVKAFGNLQKERISLYSINPGNIYVSHDFKKLSLMGLEHVAYHDRLRYTKVTPKLPYSNIGVEGY